jgi:8-oxo-dGTP diphosphatase
VASKPIQAAGGIVVRDGARVLVAIVQRSKDDAWVLPRGKLKRNENPVTGARREVVEETGHRVRVHEFLGAITYRARGRPKVVQFWRMEAEAKASHDLMADITAVEWLSLKAAVRRLSYPLEKLFLRNIGRRALANRAGAKPHKPKRKKPAQKANRKAGRKTGKRTRVSSAKTKSKNKTKKKTDARGRHAMPNAAKSHTFAAPVRRKSSRRRQKSTEIASQRIAPAVATAAQTERAIASIAAIAAKPITAAKRKSILQRMLGRLAG